MAGWEKTLEKMRRNPGSWRIEDLQSMAERFGITYTQKATSHVTFRHPAATKVTVPAHVPVKPVYVKQFVKMVDIVRGEATNGRLTNR